MPSCAIKGCTNRPEHSRQIMKRKVHFHSFPRDDSIGQKWIKACGRENFNVQKGMFTISSFVILFLTKFVFKS